MSDRLADVCGRIRQELHELHQETNDRMQQDRLLAAMQYLEEVEEADREKNGPTPTDKLAAAVSGPDGDSE